MSAFGLMTFGLLIAAPLLGGALVYAYRRSGRGQRTPVGTTYLLQMIRPKTSSKRKFKPPLRFYPELLAVFLIALGLAGLYRERPPQSIALVLDNSYSSGARTNQGDTVLERERSLAEEALADLSPEAKVELFVTSPALQSQTSGLVTTSEARRALAKILSANAPDNIDISINRIATDPAYDRSIIVTDYEPPVSAGASGVEVRSTWNKGGAKVQNSAILDVRIRNHPQGSEITVTVAHYGSAPAELRLTVEIPGEGVDFDALRAVGSEQVQVAPGTQREVRMKTLFPVALAYRVSIAELQGSSPSNKDALESDNAAWVTPLAASDEILFVSELTGEQLGLALLKNFSFKMLAAKEAAQLDFNAVDQRTIVFHRFAPSELPSKSALFVLPPAGTPFGVMREEHAGEVTRWSETSPLTSYLTLPALKLTTTYPLSVPSWAEEVVASTHGAIVAAGERARLRYAAVGVELFPYEGKRSPVMSVLTLNLLKWLSAGTSTGGYRSVGEPLLVASSVESATYMVAEARGKKIIPINGSLQLSEPGILALSSSGASPTLIAVNYFDSTESDLSRPRRIAPITAVPRVLSDLKESRDRQVLTALLAIVIFGLLLLDLVFALVALLRVNKVQTTGAVS